MPSRLSRLLRSAVPPSWRAALFALLALAWLLPAQAATYTFKSDTYAWESTTNTIAWDKLCTGYPGDDDQATITFTGGFSFTFAGTAYSSVRVLANGALQFGADTGFYRNYTNTTLPAGAGTTRSGCTSAATARTIMGYWDDLDPSHAGSGGVTWQQKGTAPNRYLVVSWNGVYQYSTTTPYTFQIILFENGEFKYQYGNANTTGASATIGVQVSDTDYTLYSFNAGYNANGTAIRWFVPSGTPTRLAEYRMDEYSWSGNVGEVTDFTGNGYGGVRVGSAANTASGYVCRGADIPANTDTSISAIDTTVDVDTALGADGGISFWYRGNAAWVSSPEAMLFDASGSASRPFFLARKSSGALRFVVADTAGALVDVSSAAKTIAAGTWAHIAVTWRLASGTGQSTARIYVNGVLSGSASATTNGNIDSSLLTLFLGDNRTGAIPANATSASANGRLDEVRVYNYEISALEIAADMAVSHGCTPPLHHVEIRHASGTGLTCTPSTLTVAACQDASCATPYTYGLTGTLTATGTPSVVWPAGAGFTMAAGSSSTTVDVQVTSAGTVVFGTTSLSTPPSNSTSCNFGSPACTFTAADAGLLFDVPAHASETAQGFSISAVRKSDNGLACTPAFANANKAITFGCSYQNPTSGTLPARVGGKALNAANNASAACDASGQAVTLAFDATGTATTTLQYADAGQLGLSAKYVGAGADAGLTLAGSDTVVVAPASFAFSGITTGPIKAGNAFSATLTARNGAGAATPNFGRETTPAVPAITFTRRQPTGSGASDGVFSGSFGSYAGGVATASNLAWTEVGRGDLTATLTNYLASGLSATGSTGTGGAVGRFTPHHFDVAVSNACSGGAYSYAGQPFTTKVTARNAGGATTLNYDGSAATSPNFAQATTLSDAGALGLGSFDSAASVAASRYTAGAATVTPAYAFTAKQTAPQTLTVRATDADGISSSGQAEGSTALRSGRLRLSNGYGSEKSALALSVQAEYWSGLAWLLNDVDSGCTGTIAAGAVALSNVRDNKGGAGSWTTSGSAITINGGRGQLTLAAPSGGATGTVDVALNLGSTAADQSCLASHPASTGAALAWLRSRNGSANGCGSAWDRDPSARAAFGVYSAETKKTVHAREIF
ncbi:MAG: LamG domain-containing protein [Burkholderiaceae bacterium]